MFPVNSTTRWSEAPGANRKSILASAPVRDIPAGGNLPRSVTSLPVPTGLYPVYFMAAKKPPTEEFIAAQRAVAWFDQNVEAIPPLDRTSRKNHRLHLQMMGEVLGLMPATASARAACQQYTDVFNALETHVAPGKKDYRMVCDKKIPAAADNETIVKHHGYYILVYGANGAIESFRRVTPSTVEIDGQNETDFKLRVALFQKTAEDQDRLESLLEEKAHRQDGVPDFLADTTRYTRTVFKPGADGLDAWQQPFTFSETKVRRKSAFEAAPPLTPTETDS